MGGVLSALFLAENNGARTETTLEISGCPVALASSLYLCMKAGGSCSARPFFDPRPPSSLALLSKLLRYSYVVDER